MVTIVAPGVLVESEDAANESNRWRDKPWFWRVVSCVGDPAQRQQQQLLADVQNA